MPFVSRSSSPPDSPTHPRSSIVCIRRTVEAQIGRERPIRCGQCKGPTYAARAGRPPHANRRRPTATAPARAAETRARSREMAHAAVSHAAVPGTCYSSPSARARGVAAQHASLSRWRSPVRIRSSPPFAPFPAPSPPGRGSSFPRFVRGSSAVRPRFVRSSSAARLRLVCGSSGARPRLTPGKACQEPACDAQSGAKASRSWRRGSGEGRAHERPRDRGRLGQY